jgi:hypothetical protein
MRPIAGFRHRQNGFRRIDGFDLHMGERIAVNLAIGRRPIRAIADHDGQEVRLGFFVHLELLTNASISEQPFADFCGQEFHGGLSFH